MSNGLRYGQRFLRRLFDQLALDAQIHNRITAHLALTVLIRITDLMTALAIAGAGHDELRAAVFACDCQEWDFLRAHGTFFCGFNHSVSILIGLIPKLVRTSGTFHKQELNPVHKVDYLSNQRDQPQEDIPAGTSQIVKTFDHQYHKHPIEE